MKSTLLALAALACGTTRIWAAEPPADAKLAAVEVAWMSTEPFDAAHNWVEIPEILQGAKVFTASVPGRPKSLAGRDLQFTVQQAGVVFIAATWTYDGNSSGGWKASSKSEAQLADEGWRHVGAVVRMANKGKRRDEYGIFARSVEAGETLTFHTRKYGPPYVVEPVDVAAALANAARTTSSADIAKLEPPSKTPQGARTQDVVQLTTHWFQRGGTRASGGLLLRELIRQSVLIAARDELGLSTRDQSLHETLLLESEPRHAPLGVLTSVANGHRLLATVFKQVGDHYEVIWDEEIVLAADLNPVSVVATRAESLSRGAFKDLLVAEGFAAHESSSEDHGSAIPEEDEVAWNAIAQFGLVRRLHAALRAEGDSPQRLAALARAYARLGSLTSRQWSPAHKAYTARALLYAERLLEATGSSPEALWTRAYVRAIVGLHQLALDDLAAARGGAAGPQPDEPEWIRPIEALCRYDVNVLLADQPAGPMTPLTRYLNLLASEYADQPTALEAAGRMLAAQPDCTRAVDVIAGQPNLDTKQLAAAHALQQMPATLYRNLESVDLPAAVVKRVEAGAQAGPDGEPRNRAVLIAELRDAGAVGRDRGEPSLDALGAIVEEGAFLSAVRMMDYLHHWLNVPADDQLQVVWPMVERHPYRGYVAMMTSRPEGRQAREDLAAALEGRDAQVLLRSMIDRLWLADRPRYQPLCRNMVNWGRDNLDAVFADQLDAVEDKADGRKPARLLRMISPHLSASVAVQIRFNWSEVEDTAGELEQKYHFNAQVQGALARAYVGSKRVEDAIRCLKRQIELAPDFEAYDLLAGIYRDRGEMDLWKATWDEYLTTPSIGLSHASVRNNVARYFLRQNQPERALPYALAAADSYASWALETAAECCACLGKWQAGEEFIRANSERYEDGALDWLLWCRRHGHGDVDAAAQHALRFLQITPSPLGDDLSRSLATYYFLTGKTELARKTYQTAFEQRRAPYDGFLAALLADQLGFTSERDAVLEQIIGHETTKERNRTRVSAAGQLALLLRDDLAASGKGDLDPKLLDSLLKEFGKTRGDLTTYAYFIGAYLLNREQLASAQKYLQLAATSPEDHKCNHCFARWALREAGVEIEPQRATEVPSQSPQEAAP